MLPRITLGLVAVVIIAVVIGANFPGIVPGFLKR